MLYICACIMLTETKIKPQEKAVPVVAPAPHNGKEDQKVKKGNKGTMSALDSFDESIPPLANDPEVEGDEWQQVMFQT